jgi:hypothetical protein|tara:strand:+ start:1080 stop:1412 length:333 start_codon:yes stop_codon:yes gene_type:complete
MSTKKELEEELENLKNQREKPVKSPINWLWAAPEYFSRWRLFPRAFISMYIYLLWDVTQWFMALPEPNTQQAGLVSVIVGSGAAWFGLYVNSNSTKYYESETIPGLSKEV